MVPFPLIEKRGSEARARTDLSVAALGSGKSAHPRETAEGLGRRMKIQDIDKVNHLIAELNSMKN
jgi:hypothetical protein